MPGTTPRSGQDHAGGDPNRKSWRTNARKTFSALTASLSRSLRGGDLFATVRRRLRHAADLVKSTSAIILFVLAVPFAAWFLNHFFMACSKGNVRINRFSVAKSLEDSGQSGANVADAFGEKLRVIGIYLNEFHVGSTERRTRKIDIALPHDYSFLGAKVPGTDFSLDNLSDMMLTVFGRPPLEVNGSATANDSEIVVTVTPPVAFLEPL